MKTNLYNMAKIISISKQNVLQKHRNAVIVYLIFCKRSGISDL